MARSEFTWSCEGNVSGGFFMLCRLLLPYPGFLYQASPLSEAGCMQGNEGTAAVEMSCMLS